MEQHTTPISVMADLLRLDGRQFDVKFDLQT